MQQSKASGQVPWLERQIALEGMRRLVERLKETHIYTADEIVRIIGERYKKLRPRRPGARGRIELELKRLELVYNISRAKLAPATAMPSADKLPPFHRELIAAFIGVEHYEEARRRVARAIRLIKRFWDEYRVLILSAESPQEASRLRREGSGRILSTVRRSGSSLKLLRKVRDELLKTHVIAEGLPVVVVAGIPSAGKSTLVAALSTAEPETAEYPFTTKTIIVGKVARGVPSFYIVDTPGLLERPPEKHNPIERRALAAIKTLPDVLLYLLDPSPTMIQDLNSQIELLKSIANLLNEKTRILVAINKIDITDRVSVNKARRALEAIGPVLGGRLCGPVLELSAATGQGLDKLHSEIIECLKQAAPWLFPAHVASQDSGR